MEIPIRADQLHPALRLIEARPEVFARQGHIAASSRSRNGQTFGPYYRLAYRDGDRALLPSPFGRGAGGEGGNAKIAENGSFFASLALTLTLSQRERGLICRHALKTGFHSSAKLSVLLADTSFLAYH